MSNSIPLSQAVDMAARYRQNKDSILAAGYDKDILPICETFDASSIAGILAEQGCTSVRIYYGMSEDLYLHAIIVAADENGADILPLEGTENLSGSGGDIVDEGVRCPPVCPPDSPLN
ncbi:MAG TPA: hypothetical protein VG738_03900 [Chitinophagaceae bacterium]|nr:hypothetical protein [Chitinophagaceae bacterium]